jgi:Xaa-Pro aminopeptidase
MKKNKLIRLRKKFIIYNIDGYIISKNDKFFGEYVDPSSERLKYLTGFSGSAGQALVLKKKAFLFVDGRYTLQAQKEIKKGFKIVEIHKTKPLEILKKNKKKLIIGFDPKLYTQAILTNLFASENIKLIPIKSNLIDKIWSNRPKLKFNKFFILKTRYVGQSYKHKINLICNILKKKKLKNLLITAPENVAWLLNIRGKDSSYSPIPNCNAIINYKKTITLIVENNKIDKNFKSHFGKNLKYLNPSNVIEYLDSLNSEENFLIDKTTCSLFYKEKIAKKFKYVEKIDPIFFLKSKKNNVEINNTIKSHIIDGVALTKFIYWIKNNINKLKITELSAQKKLEQFRKKNRNYISPSFNTISGSGPNSAIPHYRANNKTNRKIKTKDIYLCDSGGQYHYGTTDVTRTICFSEQPRRIKNIFTKVLKGHIGVATYKLKKNITGKRLDIVARSALKKSRLDYAHGTGHGVGYFLNVHEGPQAISKINNIQLKEGMILSNEPGYYESNKFGIRIENLIFIKKHNNKLKFQNLTLAPIEKDLINFKLLNKKEKKYLSEYNKKIYFILNPYLNKYEKNWLKSSIY